MSNIYNLDFSITFTNESDTFLKNKKPLKTVVLSRYQTLKTLRQFSLKL